MKCITEERTKRITSRLGVLVAAALLILAGLSLTARPHLQSMGAGGSDEREFYRQVNLVSDQPGMALIQDPDLVNAWGMAFSATGPFWISDNGTGRATLYSAKYDSQGMVTVVKLGLTVGIPGEGVPTGQVFQGTASFNADRFIFAGEDGTISGWRGALGSSAEILTSLTGAVYKGIALSSRSGAPVLLAADFSMGTIDMYDGTLNLIGQFSDADAPAGYAPFNVQTLAGKVFVTYAKQDAAKHDDVAGRGHGLIDVFDPESGAFQRFATGSDAGGKLRHFNSPWGMAIVPSTFGEHGGQLLVGNFGSGTIMAFDMNGKFRGFLEGEDGERIVIDGLWALAFGNGGSAGIPDFLYFSAGPNGESHGLFGSLEPVSQSNPARLP